MERKLQIKRQLNFSAIHYSTLKNKRMIKKLNKIVGLKKLDFDEYLLENGDLLLVE